MRRSLPVTTSPSLSYILLHGRCRHCQEAISPLYPAVEVLTAILVVVCVLDFGATAYAALAAFFCVTLVTLSAADLRYRLVPNRIVMPASSSACSHTRRSIRLWNGSRPRWPRPPSCSCSRSSYPAGLGMGDVKLTLLLGAMLGRTVGAALLIGFVAALVPSLVLLARHGSKARKMAIPLVPFLALGALVALFFGDQILDWYSGLGS